MVGQHKERNLSFQWDVWEYSLSKYLPLSVICPVNSASGRITPSNPLGQAFLGVFSHVSLENKARAYFCYLIKRSVTFIDNLTHI